MNLQDQFHWNSTASFNDKMFGKENWLLEVWWCCFLVSPATSALAKFVNNNYRILFIFGVIHFYYFTNWSLWVTKLFLFAEEEKGNCRVFTDNMKDMILWNKYYWWIPWVRVERYCRGERKLHTQYAYLCSEYISLWWNMLQKMI